MNMFVCVHLRMLLPLQLSQGVAVPSHNLPNMVPARGALFTATTPFFHPP